MTPGEPRSGGRRGLYLLLVLATWTALPGLGDRELWNPVEPRYAGVVSHLVDEGLRMVPRYQDAPYDQKPPLVFWATAALHRLGGVDRSLWLMRLPSALGLLLSVAGTFVLARRFFSVRAATAAGAVLATAALPVWSARFFHLDTLFVAAMVWTFVAVWRRVEQEGAGGSASGRGPVLLGACAVTAGFFIKGPAALGLVVLVLSMTAVFLRERRVLTRSGLVAMILAALALCALWFIAAARAEGESWWRELLVNQGLLRITSTEPPKKHGPFYYLLTWFTLLAPWSLFLPWVAFVVTRELRGRGRRDDGIGIDARAYRGLVFALTWMIVVTVVLSFGVTKRSRYLLLAAPAAAILLGFTFDHLLRRPQSHATQGAAFTARALATILAAALALGVFAGPTLLARVAPGAAAKTVEIVADVSSQGSAQVIGLIASACVLAVLITRRRPAAAFGLLVGALVLGWCLWGWAVAPALDRQRNDAAFLETLQPHLAEGRELWAVGHAGHRESSWGWFHYYTGRSVRVDDERHRAVRVAAADRPVVVIWDGRFSETGGRHPVPPDFKRVNRYRLGRRGYFIYLGGPKP